MSALPVRRVLKHAIGGADRWLPPRTIAVRILAYHSVGAGAPLELDLDEAEFRRQLDWLRSECTVISLPGLVRRLERASATDGGSGKPEVVLTFDDAYVGFARIVLPILREYGFPATVYVPTLHASEGRPFPWVTGVPARRPDLLEPLGWDALAQLAADPLITIGHHTHAHRVLPGLPAAEIIADLERGSALFERELGLRPEHFCYPEGRHSPTAVAIIRARFHSAVVGRRGDPADAWRLPRIVPVRSDPADQFARLMRGEDRLYGWSLGLLRRG